MNTTLNILVIDDSKADYLLVERHLRQHGLAARCRHAACIDEVREAIGNTGWDVVLSDYSMPGLDFRSVLDLLQSRQPDLPLILVSGSVGEEKAFELLRLGVWDFVLKDNLSRLVPAIEHSLREASDRRARRSAEEALRKSEEHFRTVFELASVGITQADPQTRKWIRVNQKMCAITGYPAAELLRMSVTDILHPDDREEDRRVFERLVRGDVPDSRIEKRYIRKDGSIAWVNVNTTVMRDAAGRVVSTIAAIEDITARKQAEQALADSVQRYRALFEGTAEGILVADADTRSFRYANPAICRMLGYSREELLKLCVDDIHPPDVLPRALDTFRGQCGEKGPLVAELSCIRKNGETIEVSISTAAVEMDGRPCLVGFFTDVTERMRAAAEKKELEDQLRQAQKLESVGRLAGGMAHDFNNVLSVILGYAGLLLDEFQEKDPVHKDLREIVTAAGRAAVLTRQLLAFSRKQTLQPVVLDLSALVANLENMLRRLIGEDVTLIARLADGLGSVMADPSQIEQAIMNLVVNARDAMPDGGTLTIETANVELDAQFTARHPGAAPGPHVMLAVTDTGCGMDEKTKGMIFDPFFTTKEQGKGTGLGLSTVYGVVAQSGGCISVSSELGHGTTFRIYLPRVEAKAGQHHEKPEQAPRGQGQLLLLVEDEPALRELIARKLPALGFRIELAANGGEALLAVEEKGLRPDLLLTDVILPGMAGTVLASRLARTLPGLKILYMSGYTDEAIDRQGLLNPGTHFIQKPFTIDGLARKITRMLHDQALIDARPHPTA
ncbi:PAS domain S-box protein [bacterium]|nr:PAS domain S-box protein [bacterium]